MEFVDVLITTEEDTSVVFKIKASGKTDDQGFKEITADSYKEVAQRLQERLLETREEIKIHFMNLIQSATFS